MARTFLALCLALAGLAGCGGDTPRRSPVGPTPVITPPPPPPPPPPPIDVRPVDPRFNDHFWQQLGFDAFEDSRYGWGQIAVLEPHAVMRLYISTTTATGRHMLFGNGLAQIVEWTPMYGRQLSGRNIIGRIHTGSYQEVDRHRARDEPGWIYVLLETDEKLSGVCGRARVGANPGTIWLNADNTDCLDLETFSHEFGHALGFFHVDPRLYHNAVMRPSWARDRGEYRFSAQEKYHARLAYEVGRGHEYCGWPFQRICATPQRARAGGVAPIVID